MNYDNNNLSAAKETLDEESIKKRFAKYNKLLLIHAWVCHFILIPLILIGIFTDKGLICAILILSIAAPYFTFVIVYFGMIRQAFNCPFCHKNLGRDYYRAVCPHCGRRIKP